MTTADDLAAARVLVIIPTYQERESLPLIVARVRTAVPTAHVLVADDNSPDGTGKIADELAANDDHLHVLHRPAKAGLGAAYVAGFRWALTNGYDAIVEMDADGSHQPEQLPRPPRRPHRRRRGPGIAVGRRSGKVSNWPKSREVLSRGANAYARVAIGIPLRDATGGFRVYRAEVLRSFDLTTVRSQGYCFQVDLALRSWQHGYRVVEVPISFVERALGASKMNRGIVLEALWRVTVWGVRARLGQLTRRRPAGSA